MNAHTAAVIDFQSPLKVSTDPIDRKTLKIHVAPHITETQEFQLRLQFVGNLSLFLRYQDAVEKAGDDVIRKCRCLETANHYKTAAMALIEGLRILQAIEEKEYDRLTAFFAEQREQS